MILEILFLLLPAYTANMAPILFRRFPFLNYPLDCRLKFRGRRLLGANKTLRGLVLGVLVAVLTAYVQLLLLSQPFFPRLAILDYSNWVLVGFLLGFGALVGDALESFVKRQKGLKPGARFMPWDQIDFVVGAFVFLSFVYTPSLFTMGVALLASFVLHIAVSHIGFYLHIRKEKW